MYKIYFLVLSSLIGISCIQSNKASTKINESMPEYSTKVIAHRGAWKNTHLPENSVAALKAAINMGCYGSEMDVHMTTDGYIVVNHDPHFHKIEIQNADLSQLRKFKLNNGDELPLLSDFLKVIVKQRKTKLIVEIKPSIRGKDWAMQTTQKVIDEINKYNASSHVAYISFDFDICKEVLKLVPGAKVQYLNGDKTPGEIKAAGLAGMDYHYSVFQRHPEYLPDSKELALETNAWTVNDPVVMDWLIAHGVDFITTNEPELSADKIQASPLSKGYHLAWSDEFLYDGLPDATKWDYEEGGNGWGNNEKQFYTNADTNNAIVRKGMLHIVARKEKKVTADYTSARLVTNGKAAWKYGRIEARAKLPKGVGLWPAFWMLGSDIKEVGWPECGEIDIMEHVGYKPDEILGTVHTKAFNHLKGTQKGKSVTIKNPYDDFNTFAIEWNPESVRFYLNDLLYNEFSNKHKTNAEWPFDKPFFIILNLAVGGNLGGKEGIDESAFPASYVIDYVRVFQK